MSAAVELGVRQDHDTKPGTALTVVRESLPTLVIQTVEASTIAGFVLPDGNNVGPYKQWITEWTGLHSDDVHVVNVADGEQITQNPNDFALILGTGSGRETSENTRWMQDTRDFKRAADGTDVVQYDICFMHQLRAEAQGGATADAPLGLRFPLGEVTKTKAGEGHPLYEGLPSTFVIFQSNRRFVSEPGNMNGEPAVQLLTGSHKNEALLTGPNGMSAQHHAEGRVDIWTALAQLKLDGGSLKVPSASGELVKPTDEQFGQILNTIKTVGQQAEANGKRIGQNLHRMAGKQYRRRLQG